MLDREFKYYIENQNKIFEKYKGKFVVIIGEDVISSFDSLEDAYYNSKEKYELGTFLIEQALKGNEHYTNIINRTLF